MPVLRNCVPPLCPHVVKIVFLGSKEKVLRVNARSIIASMKNAKAGRNFPTENLIDNAMNVVLFPAYLDSAIGQHLPKSFVISARPDLAASIGLENGLCLNPGKGAGAGFFWAELFHGVVLFLWQWRRNTFGGPG